jgi:hypothetical protein
VAFISALPVWLLLTAMFGRDLIAVESASGESYEQQRSRVIALEARLTQLEAELARLEPSKEPESSTKREYLEAARSLVDELHHELGTKYFPLETRHRRSPYRWFLADGYVNVWRTLQQAEDLTLFVESRDVVYTAAIDNAERLCGLAQTVHASALCQELSALTGVGIETYQIRSRGIKSEIKHIKAMASSTDEEAQARAEARARLLKELDQGWARALVSEASNKIHTSENDLWMQIVILRNRLFLAFVLAVSLVYLMIGLAVLREVKTEELTAAVAFLLTGAVVGVFNELYSASRRKTGSVFDYGFASLRVLVTPVLSGIAAVGGVVVTNLAGSYVVTKTSGATNVPSLSQVFNLSGYRMGVVVAAIFGLTPGLLLSRLRDRTDAYKQEIEQLRASSTTDGD